MLAPGQNVPDDIAGYVVPHSPTFKPPIKLFWPVTVYGVDTRAMIMNEQKIADHLEHQLE